MTSMGKSLSSMHKTIPSIPQLVTLSIGADVNGFFKASKPSRHLEFHKMFWELLFPLNKLVKGVVISTKTVINRYNNWPNLGSFSLLFYI
jgi:hypothetical protein